MARTPAQFQSLLSEAVDAVGDTYRVQQPSAPDRPAGTGLVVSDTAPTTDRWNLTVGGDRLIRLAAGMCRTEGPRPLVLRSPASV